MRENECFHLLMLYRLSFYLILSFSSYCHPLQAHDYLSNSPPPYYTYASASNVRIMYTAKKGEENITETMSDQESVTSESGERERDGAKKVERSQEADVG